MNAEFKKTGPTSAVSSKGFRIIRHSGGWIEYSDASGTITIEWELIVKPSFGVLIYPRGGGLKSLTEARADEVVNNTVRALQFLGERVEIWKVENW
jgi:hypothetical protein